ncbi:MAG: hypothetical protein WA188_13920 [Terriglobales bacterium]
MDAADRGTPTRIAISRQTIPLWIVGVLVLFVELVLCFVVFAIMRPRGSSWWIAACVAMVLAWALYWKNAHGRRDWNRTVHVEIEGGKIALIPDLRMRWSGYTAAEAPFPTGARLEYHIETGDRYLTGDHAQVLRRSLWVIEPTGAKRQLLGSGAHLSLRIAAMNLEAASIPFRIIQMYDGQEGEHTETDVTAERVRASTKAPRLAPFAILIGTSSLWLGALAGAMVHNWGYVIAIGVFGWVAVAVLTIACTASKRAALIEVTTLIPSYGAGYAVAVLVVRHLFNR